MEKAEFNNITHILQLFYGDKFISRKPQVGSQEVQLMYGSPPNRLSNVRLFSKVLSAVNTLNVLKLAPAALSSLLLHNLQQRFWGYPAKRALPAMRKHGG